MGRWRGRAASCWQPKYGITFSDGRYRDKKEKGVLFCTPGRLAARDRRQSNRGGRGGGSGGGWWGAQRRGCRGVAGGGAESERGGFGGGSEEALLTRSCVYGAHCHRLGDKQ